MTPTTRKILRDYCFTIVSAVGIALLIRTFVIEAYQIPGHSMSPTLLSGDTIFVGKWFYGLNREKLPERGEVIVYSGTAADGRSQIDSIKRVLGLPGDEIAFKEGVLSLNGKKLKMPEKGTQSENFGPQRIPAGKLFVIADNRSVHGEAPQSKSWSLISLSALKGKALWIWLSVEPSRGSKTPRSWLPTLRLERMFRRIQ